MSLTGGVRRASVAWLIAVMLVAGSAFAATPKHAAAAAAVPALPEPLTKDTVRDLVARLSDDEVRKLLLDQLDRAAATSSKPQNAQGKAGGVDQSAAMMRGRLEELGGALVALPETLGQVGAKLTEPDGPSRLLLLAGLLAAALGVGWIGERAFDAALLGYRERLRQAPAATFTAKAFRLATGLALDVIGLAAFGLAALATLLVFWHDHDLQRGTLFEVLMAVVTVRGVALFARFLLAPGAASARLLPFADAPAQRLYRFAVTIAILFGLQAVAVSVLRGGGAGASTIDLVVVGGIVLMSAVILRTVWQVREPVAALIRGDGKSRVVVRWLADLWPVIATVYILGVAAGRIFDILSGEPLVLGVGLLSVVLVVTLPVVDMALCRALAAAASQPPADGGSRMPRIVASYEPVFRRAIHIVVVVIGLIAFAHLWEFDVFALAQKSLGGKIASSLVGTCVVLLLAYIVWEIAKTAIDRRLDAEGDMDPDHPASRVRTLLPIVRLLIFVTIVVMATMSTLAALGVDILPLLAGASVIGVAIGFGSQTLVRDVVSGAFFLMDDAFRLGEYIEVGDAKGRVEKINIRSLFLRHHRGALNILPYGEIKRLRNTSRDWVVMVLDFRLTYDTSLLAVKKVLKQVGDEIAADPELAPDLLQPLKLGGVMATEDSAIVVRAKFMARPEGEPWMIQKAAYTKILKAFREAGIKFAHRQVTVYVPPSAGGDDASKAAAGAAAIAAQPANPAG